MEDECLGGVCCGGCDYAVEDVWGGLGIEVGARGRVGGWEVGARGLGWFIFGFDRSLLFGVSCGRSDRGGLVGVAYVWG